MRKELRHEVIHVSIVGIELCWYGLRKSAAAMNFDTAVTLLATIIRVMVFWTSAWKCHCTDAGHSALTLLTHPTIGDSTLAVSPENGSLGTHHLSFQNGRKFPVECICDGLQSSNKSTAILWATPDSSKQAMEAMSNSTVHNRRKLKQHEWGALRKVQFA